MKKIILCIGFVVIVVLVGFNLNLTFKNEFTYNVELTSIFSVAKNEGGQGTCDTKGEIMGQSACSLVIYYYCAYGSYYSCWVGQEVYQDMCWPYDSAIISGVTVNCN